MVPSRLDGKTRPGRDGPCPPTAGWRMCSAIPGVLDWHAGQRCHGPPDGRIAGSSNSAGLRVGWGHEGRGVVEHGAAFHIYGDVETKKVG